MSKEGLSVHYAVAQQITSRVQPCAETTGAALPLHVEAELFPDGMVA
jgi:hypothetical protein